MNIQIFYIIMLALSLLLSGLFFWRWHKHMEVAFTMIFMIIPLVEAGYVLSVFAKDLGGVVTSIQLIYLGGIYLQPIITANIFSLCRIRIPRIVTFLVMIFSTLIYIGVLSIGHNSLFYKKAELIRIGNLYTLQKEYGFVHTVFLCWVIFLFVVSLSALIYARARIPEASIKVITLLFITELITVCAYLFVKNCFRVFEPVSVAYIISMIVYLIIVDRICLYDIEDTVIDSLLEQGTIGYLSFDFSHNYLGSTRMAKKLLPQLCVAQVDRKLVNKDLFEMVEEYLEDFKKDEVSRDHFYRYNDKIYLVRISFLFDGSRKRGYQMEISDDTRHQNYLKSLEDYNSNLREELAKKTELIERLRAGEKV